MDSEASVWGRILLCRLVIQQQKHLYLLPTVWQGEWVGTQAEVGFVRL